MTFLLDVNVLIALIDSRNIHHGVAHTWFASIGDGAWATCPLTENGVLRVVGNPRFPNSPGNPRIVAESLDSLLGQPGHEFWPDDISLLDREKFDLHHLLNASQVTDSYLLALAIAHGGQLATLDRRLVSDAVRNGAQGLHLISPNAP
jgi:toxin-antitoxin system PIN domain toxin